MRQRHVGQAGTVANPPRRPVGPGRETEPLGAGEFRQHEQPGTRGLRVCHPGLPRRLSRQHPLHRLVKRVGLQPARPPLSLPAAHDQSGRSSTLRWREIAGRLTENGSASSFTVASPSASRVRIERRVGSARAAKVKLSWSVGTPARGARRAQRHVPTARPDRVQVWSSLDHSRVERSGRHHLPTGTLAGEPLPPRLLVSPGLSPLNRAIHHPGHVVLLRDLSSDASAKRYDIALGNHPT
jgi:hypothetical protein